MAGRHGGALPTVGAILLALGAMLVMRETMPTDAALANLRGATLAAGYWAPALYVVGFAFAMVLALPAIPFTLAAGFLFGPGPGIVYAWAGACLGTIAAFGLARSGRRPVRSFLERRSARLLRFLDDHSFGAVVAVRVLMLPFGLTSYGLGLAGVHWRCFVWGTLLGVVPPIVAFVLFGAAVGDWTLLLQPTFVVPLALAMLVTGAGAWAVTRRTPPSEPAS